MKRRVVIKIGGSILEDDTVLDELAHEIESMHDECVMIIHGGGKHIGSALESYGMDCKFVDGLRVTDSNSINIVEQILSGLVNKRIVRFLVNRGIKAIGISGIDCSLFIADKRVCQKGDLGFVGDISKVNTNFLNSLLELEIVPVISPISLGMDGYAYNVNADHAAADVAVADRADDLIFVTDVSGIMVDGNVQPVIFLEDVESLITEEHITGGMVPKIRSAVQCVEVGVGRVHIVGWKGPGSLTDTMNESETWGTVIRKRDLSSQ